jgi:hypothetical protein
VSKLSIKEVLNQAAMRALPRRALVRADLVAEPAHDDRAYSVILHFVDPLIHKIRKYRTRIRFRSLAQAKTRWLSELARL